MTKQQFKQLHRQGSLLCLWAGGQPKEVYMQAIADKLKEGVNLKDYAHNTTSHGFIDNKEHKLYEDEVNKLVYLENIYQYGNKTAYNTVIYLNN
jgi:acetate kinase